MRIEPVLAALCVGALVEALPVASALAGEDPADVERPQPTRVSTSLERGPAALAVEVPWARTTPAVAYGSPKLIGTWALTSPAISTLGVTLRSEIELHTDQKAVSLGDSTAATSVGLLSSVGPLALSAAFGPRVGSELEWTYEAAIAAHTAPWMSVGAKMTGVSQRRLDAHEAFVGSALDVKLRDNVVVSSFAGRGVRTQAYDVANWMVWAGATLPL